MLPNKPRTFSCLLCNAEGFTSSAMEEHLQQFHSSPTESASSSVSSMKDSVTLLPTDSVTCCIFCDFTTASNETLQNHIRTEHLEQNVCPLCDLVFSAAGDAEIHLAADHADIFNWGNSDMTTDSLETQNCEEVEAVDPQNTPELSCCSEDSMADSDVLHESLRLTDCPVSCEGSTVDGFEGENDVILLTDSSEEMESDEQQEDQDQPKPQYGEGAKPKVMDVRDAVVTSGLSSGQNASSSTSSSEQHDSHKTSSESESARKVSDSNSTEKMFDCPFCSFKTASEIDINHHVNSEHMMQEEEEPVPGLQISCTPVHSVAVDLTPPMTSLVTLMLSILMKNTYVYLFLFSCTDLDRKMAEALQEQETKKAQRQTEQFKQVQAQFGMDTSVTAKQQFDANLEKAVSKGQMSAAEFHQKKAQQALSDQSGVDDGSTQVAGIIEKLQLYYSGRGCPRTVARVYLCNSTHHYSSSYGDKGWGCGYRNFQMLLSCLVNDATYLQVLFNGQNKLPSIRKLQHLIERAWQAGFDPQGCEQLGGKVVNTRKWIGATEIMATLSSLHIKCQLLDFHAPSGPENTHPTMINWVRDYFKNSPGFTPPLYLQHQGHSRTIVGVEELRNGGWNLLLFDPGTAKSRMRQFLGAIDYNTLQAVRKTPKAFRARQYQIVAVMGVLKEREYETTGAGVNAVLQLVQATTAQVCGVPSGESGRMAAADEDVKVHMLSGDDGKANGIEESKDATLESDEDADGQAVDPTRAKPKVRNMYFEDGVRRIDFILAWSIKPSKKQEQAEKARQLFEENLRVEGLKLEYDRRGDEIHFAKVHAPYEVLRRYADILKIRLPMKEHLVERHGKKFEDLQSPVHSVSTRLWGAAGRLFRKFLAPFEVDRTVVTSLKRKYTCPYSSDKEYLFEIPEDKETMFSNACRSWIVDFILRRKSFSEDKQKAYSFGVRKMIADEFYCAAFPLHEGHWKPGSADNERKLLFDHWAWWKSCFKFQPLDHIRHYFGEKIGLYFAWLGFYTAMLIPASIMGLAVFIYGLTIMYTNIASKELCESNITMCPLCDVQCPYWKLHEACSHAAVSRIFDNGATVFFAIFMSLWGTMFLEFWKRKQATIQYKWDLTNFVSEEEPPRPEYLSKLENWHTMKVNPVTGLKEPHLPFWRKRFPIFLCSYTVMLFLAGLAIVAVIGVIAYRVATLAALQLIPNIVADTNSSEITTLTVDLVYQNASLVTTVTAALINLLIIIILNIVYGYLAFWLTDWECLRTQSEYDNSITIKLFALQFVNYFSSIVYIAFFKGRFVGRPGKYSTIFGARQEELAIIMIGKQLIQNNLIEIVVPKLIKLIKRKCSKETREQKLARTPWEKDFKLQPAGSTSLFYEYLEMVLQFGFLTIFCAAFPLAPLFALINNIMEIRVDASKFITQLRRPIAERSATIVISNAFIIALTSDFIPRLVYQMRYSETNDLQGYVNFSLAYFNTSDFQPNHGPAPILRGNIQECRYRDFRNPYWEDKKYEYSDVFWHVLAARLAFVVVFENVVVVVTSLMAWLIPDVPTLLKEQIRREAYITSEIILRTELQRARGDEIDATPVTSGDAGSYGSDRYSPRTSDDDLEMEMRRRPTEKSSEVDDKTYV
ncbi:hypothetical protein BaRGS_00014156 [Batillaria attramentaria]|uniref:Anoctamin n=1 Tax=Batillaria attramentaria TaxID=370345 RepID=A0ABD0L5G3_9CAEN